VSIIAGRVDPDGQRVTRAEASGPASHTAALAVEVAARLADGWAA
jgi:hypothetical protein